MIYKINIFKNIKIANFWIVINELAIYKDIINLDLKIILFFINK